MLLQSLAYSHSAHPGEVCATPCIPVLWKHLNGTGYLSIKQARTFPFSSRTLPRLLERQAARYGDKPLITSPERSISYAEAPDIAARSAGRLAAAGLKAGDRIVAFMSNSMDFIELWFGAAWLGAALAPVNTAFRGAQLRHALHLLNPALIVTEQNLLVYLDEPDLMPPSCTRVRVTEHNGNAGASRRLKAEPAPAPGAAPDAHAAQPGDTVAILLTSGTSGPSKGVICSHAQFFWWGKLTGEALEVSSDDVLFTVLPFFHTNALNTIWQALLAGASYTFERRFSASRFWAQAQQAGATVTYLLGAMVHILMKQPEGTADRAHQVRACLSPATPANLVEQFRQRFGVHCVDGYGSTETNLVMANTIGGYAPGSMGRVVPGFEVRIVDENDCEVADGAPGELLVRHSEPFSMAGGYFDNPEATARAWRNLWFHTGDRVRRDEQGLYHYLDRITDAIRRRGENISSWEVEQALLAHPQVKNAAVIGVPAEVGEEDVMAFIIARDDARPEPAALSRFLQDRLAGFAIPRYLEFVDELPMTENGKVKKYLLRQTGVSPQTWDRDAAQNDSSERPATEP